MSIAVKSEPQQVSASNSLNPASEWKSAFMQLCAENGEGVSDQLVQQHFGHMGIAERVMMINELLADQQIELVRAGDKLLYKAKDLGAHDFVDQQEQLVYNAVKDAGNKGAWVRDVRVSTGLKQIQLNRVLKSLEGKRLIKAVKSVSESKKKVYMLFELEPDNSVTGGLWYSEQRDFETEFVDVMCQQCHAYLVRRQKLAKERSQDPVQQRQMSLTDSAEVCRFIAESGMSTVKLTPPDVDRLMQTLVADGKADMVVSATALGLTRQYLAVEPFGSTVGIAGVPCLVCPVFDDCHVDGVVSPANCVYLARWLDF